MGTRAPILIETRVNARWSLDFVHDQFGCGRCFRVLNIVNDVTRECLAAIPDTSISGMYAALTRAAERRRGIRITEFEQRQLKAIRDELDRDHAERTASAIRSNVTAPQSRLSSKDRT